MDNIIIYSQFHSIEKSLSELDRIELPADLIKTAEENQKDLELLIKQLEEESVYEFLPHRIEKSKKLINIAVTLSTRYDIDLEIIKKEDCYQLTLYTYSMPYMGDIKTAFAVMFYLCDEANVDGYNGKYKNKYNVVYTFTIYTHKLMIGEKQVGFFDFET